LADRQGSSLGVSERSRIVEPGWDAMGHLADGQFEVLGRVNAAVTNKDLDSSGSA
jgi:hypothetical protein